MVKLVSLIALEGISDSIGFFERGQEFRVHPRYGQSLVEAGKARFKKVNGFDDEQPRAGRVWEGGTAVIIGGGPSLTEADVELVRLWRFEVTNEIRRVVVINTSFRIAPWADVLYAADLGWWKAHHAEAAKVFKGEMWSQNDSVRKRFGAHHVQCERRPGLSPTKGVIHGGGNSGYQAIGLATGEFGVKKALLLAFDMKRTGGKSHHHGDHPAPLRQSSPFQDWLRSFKKFALDLSLAKYHVINCTRSTALHEFDEMPITVALAKELKPTPVMAQAKQNIEPPADEEVEQHKEGETGED